MHADPNDPSRLKGLKTPNSTATPGRLLYIYVISFVNKTAQMVTRTYTLLLRMYLYTT